MLNEKLKKNLFKIFKIIFVVSPFVFIYLKADRHALLTVFKNIPIITIPILFVVLFTRILLQSYRFWTLLHPFTKDFSVFDIFRFDMKAKYYSIVLPSSVGQDIVRGAFIKEKLPINLITAISLFFRISGIIPLVFLSAIGFFCGKTSAEFSHVYPWLVFGILLFILMNVILFSSRITNTIMNIIGKILPQKLNDFLKNVFSAIQLYKKHKFLIIYTIIISTITQLCTIIFAAIALYAVTGQVYFVECLSFISLIEILTILIPFAPNGAGAREILYTLFFQYLNRNQSETALFITLCASTYIINLSGMIFIIAEKLQNQEKNKNGL